MKRVAKTPPTGFSGIFSHAQKMLKCPGNLQHCLKIWKVQGVCFLFGFWRKTQDAAFIRKDPKLWRCNGVINCHLLSRPEGRNRACCPIKWITGVNIKERGLVTRNFPHFEELIDFLYLIPFYVSIISFFLFLIDFLHILKSFAHFGWENQHCSTSMLWPCLSRSLSLK